MFSVYFTSSHTVHILSVGTLLPDVENSKLSVARPYLRSVFILLCFPHQSQFPPILTMTLIIWEPLLTSTRVTQLRRGQCHRHPRTLRSHHGSFLRLTNVTPSSPYLGTIADRNLLPSHVLAALIPCMFFNHTVRIQQTHAREIGLSTASGSMRVTKMNLHLMGEFGHWERDSRFGRRDRVDHVEATAPALTLFRTASGCSWDGLDVKDIVL